MGNMEISKSLHLDLNVIDQIEIWVQGGAPTLDEADNGKRVSFHNDPSNAFLPRHRHAHLNRLQLHLRDGGWTTSPQNPMTKLARRIANEAPHRHLGTKLRDNTFAVQLVPPSRWWTPPYLSSTPLRRTSSDEWQLLIHAVLHSSSLRLNSKKKPLHNRFPSLKRHLVLQSPDGHERDPNDNIPACTTVSSVVVKVGHHPTGKVHGKEIRMNGFLRELEPESFGKDAVSE